MANCYANIFLNREGIFYYSGAVLRSEHAAKSAAAKRRRGKHIAVAQVIIIEKIDKDACDALTQPRSP